MKFLMTIEPVGEPVAGYQSHYRCEIKDGDKLLAFHVGTTQREAFDGAGRDLANKVLDG